MTFTFTPAVRQPVPLPSRDRLHEMFRLDGGTLIRKWRADLPDNLNVRFAGQVAGHVSKRGYVQVGIGHKLFLAHRIIWKMVHGDEPNEIDHINGDPTDNRPCNLRSATRSQNLANRAAKHGRSLPKGVRRTRHGKFRAEITISGRCVALGNFDTTAEASTAFEAAARARHGQFARIT